MIASVALVAGALFIFDRSSTEETGDQANARSGPALPQLRSKSVSSAEQVKAREPIPGAGNATTPRKFFHGGYLLPRVSTFVDSMLSISQIDPYGHSHQIIHDTYQSVVQRDKEGSDTGDAATLPHDWGDDSTGAKEFDKENPMKTNGGSDTNISSDIQWEGMQRYGPTERAVTLWGHEIACLGPFGDMNYIANVLALAIPKNQNVPLTHPNCLFTAP